MEVTWLFEHYTYDKRTGCCFFKKHFPYFLFPFLSVKIFLFTWLAMCCNFQIPTEKLLKIKTQRKENKWETICKSFRYYEKNIYFKNLFKHGVAKGKKKNSREERITGKNKEEEWKIQGLWSGMMTIHTYTINVRHQV